MLSTVKYQIFNRYWFWKLALAKFSLFLRVQNICAVKMYVIICTSIQIYILFLFYIIK